MKVLNCMPACNIFLGCKYSLIGDHEKVFSIPLLAHIYHFLPMIIMFDFALVEFSVVMPVYKCHSHTRKCKCEVELISYHLWMDLAEIVTCVSMKTA